MEEKLAACGFQTEGGRGVRKGPIGAAKAAEAKQKRQRSEASYDERPEARRHTAASPRSHRAIPHL